MYIKMIANITVCFWWLVLTLFDRLTYAEMQKVMRISATLNECICFVGVLCVVLLGVMPFISQCYILEIMLKYSYKLTHVRKTHLNIHLNTYVYVYNYVVKM